MTRVFLLAGEASGDALGAALMTGLRQLDPSVTFEGVAGPKMQAEGMVSLFPMEELSVMGLTEVLPKYRHLKRRIAETAAAVAAARPDVLVTIDSPDFSLRVARLLRQSAPDQRIVHYVAPSVWAWRPGRAQKMAPLVDQVLALLPFEPPYLEAVGLRCDFVGHPVVAEPVARDDEVAELRRGLGLDASSTLVLALPGSRRGEVTRLMPVFGAALHLLAAKRPGIEVILPVAPGLHGLVQDLARAWEVPVHLVPASDTMQKKAAFRAGDVALAASGTVSLELAAAETPMVVAYRMSWLTMKIMQRMALIDTVTLVNLVSETRVVPEFLGRNCLPEPIADALIQTLDAPEAQLDAARLTMQRLGAGGEAPGLRAARVVLDGLAKSRPTQRQ